MNVLEIEKRLLEIAQTIVDDEDSLTYKIRDFINDAMPSYKTIKKEYRTSARMQQELAPINLLNLTGYDGMVMSEFHMSISSIGLYINVENYRNIEKMVKEFILEDQKELLFIYQSLIAIGGVELMINLNDVIKKGIHNLRQEEEAFELLRMFKVLIDLNENLSSRCVGYTSLLSREIIQNRLRDSYPSYKTRLEVVIELSKDASAEEEQDELLEQLERIQRNPIPNDFIDFVSGIENSEISKQLDSIILSLKQKT